MHPPHALIHKAAQFLREEDGAAYTTVSFLVATLTLAVPAGVVFYHLYGSVCTGARQANMILGLF